MTKSVLLILLDFGFLALAVYYAIVERGTFSGFCWTIVVVAWVALIVNAIFSVYKD
jgi:hypothetical protein